MELTKTLEEPTASIRSSVAALAVTIGVRLALGVMSLVFDCWVAFTPYEDLFRPQAIIEGGEKQ